MRAGSDRRRFVCRALRRPPGRLIEGPLEERIGAGVPGHHQALRGTLALDDVHLEVRAGEILALLGENGAGKSTLIKILASVYTLDTGSVEFRGRDATGTLRRLPISFIHRTSA